MTVLDSRVRTPLFLALLAAGALAPLPVAGQEGSPAGPVPREFLEGRRARLLDELQGRPAVFGSSRLRDLETDYLQDSDFRQDNDFFYLTGLEAPESWLLLNVHGPGSVTLYLPPRDAASEVWTGPRMGPGPEAARLSGIGDVRSSRSLGSDLAESLGSRRGDGSGGELLVHPGHPDNRPVLDDALRGWDGATRSPAPLLAELRLVKDREEQRRLRRALEITMEAQREAWRVTEPGLHEYEIEAVIEFVFRAEGAERVGFPSIVGAGPNSVVLHYDKNRRRTEAGDLVVADVGAEFGYYTADVTRTFPVSGTFSERQRRIYELVLGAQEAALAAVRPGNTIRDVQLAAVRHMDRNSNDLCGRASCSQHFVHGVSHWLGMDVHDVGPLLAPFVPGMVLTVEPGIYLASEGLGVRIEDVALVTEDGHELLTGALPRGAREIEAVMAEPPRWIRGTGPGGS